MSDADQPPLRIGDYVIDRKSEGDSLVMLVVKLTLERADAVYIDDETTVADVNDDEYETNDVV